MSQEFLLKTPAAPVVPKAENTKVATSHQQEPRADKPSFSSELEKKIEQHGAPKDMPVEKKETSEASTDTLEKNNSDNEQNGNTLPEDASAETQSVEITAESPLPLSEPVETELDTSIVTELKAEVIQPSTKSTPVEKLITVKNGGGNTFIPDPKIKDKSNIPLGVTSNVVGNAANSEGIALGEKPQTTSLRSDIFHALTKNKSAELLATDSAGSKDHKSLLASVTERAPASFSATLTSTSLNTASLQTSSASQPLLAVQPAIHSEAWNRVLSSRVVWMAREGISEASLRLNPANLGPVEVRLNMHNDQANVLFIAQNAATRDALEQALPRLRESFEQNGMQLADADVAEQNAEQAEDEHTDGEGGHQNGAMQSQAEIEGSDEHRITAEQDVEVGLSLYA